MNKGNVMKISETQGHSRREGNKLGGQCVKNILYVDSYNTRMMTELVLERVTGCQELKSSRNECKRLTDLQQGEGVDGNVSQ